MNYDVVIIGGGPAGLSAALTLGRARRKVLLCDAGPRRNAAAAQMHNFVSRDGITPDEFRRVSRLQLESYPNVEIRETRVEELRGEEGAFELRLSTGVVAARRLLLCTGMIDVVPELDGIQSLWGRAVFQCPYCHGWEIKDQRFGYLATNPELLSFPLLLRGWSRHVTLLTNGRIALPADLTERLVQAGIEIDDRPIARLVPDGERLCRVELADGGARPLDALFVHPPQRQVPFVESLKLAQTPAGYLAVDAAQETSTPGIYAAGDLLTPVQSAIFAAASGVMAAGALNHALTTELALAGALP